jgi:large-conductance mechanosensitive channel
MLAHVIKDAMDYGDFILPTIGFVATGFAVSSTVPQISKALRTKKSDVYHYAL